jgi:hypothetical protein
MEIVLRVVQSLWFALDFCCLCPSSPFAFVKKFPSSSYPPLLKNIVAALRFVLSD